MPVVTAVGLAAPVRSGHAARIEAAMRRALEEAQGEGVTNPSVLKARMEAARRQAKRELRGGGENDVAGRGLRG